MGSLAALNYSYHQRLYRGWPHLGGVSYPLEFLYGPRLYGYVRVLTGHALRRCPEHRAFRVC